MSEFKGTPGPWVADKTSRAVGPISRNDDQSYGILMPVAWVEFDTEVEIQASNQNLIAAAPELLEALKELISGYEDREKSGMFDMLVHGDLIEKANVAINKALGEKQ